MGAEALKRDAAAAASGAADTAMARTPDQLPSRLLAELPVGVALLDSQLYWRYANDAFLQLTGLPAEAFSGSPLSATALGAGSGSASGSGPGPGADGAAEAGEAAALVLADGGTRELVVGLGDERIRVRLQRVAAETAGGEPMVLVVALLDAAPETEPLVQSRGSAAATSVSAATGGSPTAADATVDASSGPPAPTPAAPTPAAPAPAAPRSVAPSDEELLVRRRLATLTAAGERIGTTLDTDTTCTELARFTVPTMADLATVDILPPGVPDHRLGAPLGNLRLLRAAVAGRPGLHPQLATLAHPGESVRHREGSLVARCLLAGKPIVQNLAGTPGDANDAAAVSDPATLEVYRAAGATSIVAVPLAARGHLLGALTLARGPHAATEPPGGETADGERRADRAPGGEAADYSDEDLALIEDLAARAALSIDNARRYMRSQGIALELQRALLAEPANPHPNMETACRYLPSGSTSVVGGDWYESVRLPFGRTLLVIGDVMGHGVEAAVDMSTYRSMLRYVAVMDLPPHRILRQLDTLISENEAARPATCLLALVDPPRNRVTFASAGHLPPALVGPSGVTELVEVPSGPPLGTGVGGYQQLVRELVPGAVLLLYTDGLVERRHEDIDVSLERLAALPLPATGELDDLLDAVLHSSTPSEAEDDIALLAARVRARP